MQFVYHKRSQPTGEKLASAFQISHGLEINPENNDVLIRWGSRKDPHLDEEFGRVLNKSQSIAKASNKIWSFSEWGETEVNYPQWDEDPLALIERVGYPILGRKSNGSRGTDIGLILQKKDFRDKYDFYVQYIPTVREYRIHVVGEEVVRVQGKFLDDASQAKPWIRNYATGYRFRSPRKRLRRERLEMATNAVKSLGLDFGAVDLIVADDGLGYVLEVNTAPACSPLTATAYINAIGRLIGHNGPYDFTQLDLLNPNEEEDDSEDLDEEEE